MKRTLVALRPPGTKRPLAPRNETGYCRWCGRKLGASQMMYYGHDGLGFCTLNCAYQFAMQALIDGARYFQEGEEIFRNYKITQHINENAPPQE